MDLVLNGEETPQPQRRGDVGAAAVQLLRKNGLKVTLLDEAALYLYNDDSSEARTRAGQTMNRLVKSRKAVRVRKGAYIAPEHAPKPQPKPKTKGLPEVGTLLEFVGSWGSALVLKDVESGRILVAAEIQPKR